MHLKCDGQEGRQHARTWKKIQENIGRKLLGGSSTVAGVTVRGDLGWKAGGEKLSKRLGWRLQRMSEDRLVRKVVALLNDCRSWWAEYYELKSTFGMEGS